MRAPRPAPRLAAALLGLALLAMGGPALAASAPTTASGAAATSPTVTASSATSGQPASKIADADRNSYWQSSGAAFPQWARVDLGKITRIGGVVMKVPAGWSSRTETLAVQGSDDGQGYSTLVGAKPYKFDPQSDNTVRVDFGTQLSRFVRVEITGNSAGSQAQLSDLEVVPAAVDATNLATGKAMTASGSVQNYTPGNANDGNQGSYWESTNNAFPQWLQVDLGASVSSTQIVLKLPTVRLGRPHRDAGRAGQHRRRQLLADRRLRRLHLRPGVRQHRDDQLHPGHHPVRAAEHHRQHRLAGRPDLGVRGVRPEQRRHPAADRAHRASPTPSRPPGRSSSPGPPRPTTSASPATTSTPTTRCAPALPAPC